MKMTVLLTVLAASLIGGLPIAHAEELDAERHVHFGGAMAPAVMPAGAASVFAAVGVPELSLGFRQSVQGLEVGAAAELNYLLLQVGGELSARAALVRGAELVVGPYLGAGLILNSGARYFDPTNFRATLVRARAGMAASYRAAETVQVVADLTAPIDFSLGTGGGGRTKPMAGVGAEVYLGEDVTVLAFGALGAEIFREPQGITSSRLAFQLKLGVGYRLF